jgi:hypothetical protein
MLHWIMVVERRGLAGLSRKHPETSHSLQE